MDWRSFFFSFRGRINRAKYWLALLIFTIVGMVQGLVGFALGNAVLFQIFNFLIDLAVLVASVAVGIKRLHDRDRSAWWLLLFYLGPVVFAGAGGAIMSGWRELCRNDRGLVAISAALPARWFCARDLGSGRDRFPARERGLQSLRANPPESTKAGLDLRPNRKPLRKSGEENGRGASRAQAGRNLQFAP